METIISAFSHLRQQVKLFWYAFAAPSLVDERNKFSQHFSDAIVAYADTVEELSKKEIELLVLKEEFSLYKRRENTPNRDGAIAVQVIKERMHVHEGVYAAQSRAMKQRNRELIIENEHLRRLLKRLTSEKINR